ncbi:catalase, partial [bacterium]|nr:catalase [bacterium]
NKNPRNYFAEVEQAAFSPANIVPGIGFSNDKMLLGRLFSYPDTQRYRVGTNYMQLEVNKPHAAKVFNYMADGHMATNEHLGQINYQPNSYDNYKFLEHDDLSAQIENKFQPGYYDQDIDYYSQPKAFIEVLKKQGGTEYADFVYHIANSLKLAKKSSIDRILKHFEKICPVFTKDVIKEMEAK